MMRSTFCRSEPGPYTMPFHVPATAPMSVTGTGLAGPRLAQPTSETAIPTTRTAAVHSTRDPLGSLATPLLPGVNEFARSTPAIVSLFARTCSSQLHQSSAPAGRPPRAPCRLSRSQFLDLPTGAGSPWFVAPFDHLA